MSYELEALKSSSQKVVFCWLEPAQQVFLFTLDTGAIYKKNPNYFVVGVKQDSTDLTEASSSSLNAGEFYYSPIDNELFVRMSDDSSPDTKKITLTYRLFFANQPINIDYDLNGGASVEYSGILKSNSAIKREIDHETIGIALESQTSLSFINGHGYFDPIIDKLIFENKSVKVYSWITSTPLSEKQLMFDGIIESKRYNYKSVNFKCKDFVFLLNQPVSLSLFSESDGTPQDSVIGKPKRRLYGKFQQLECTGIDSVNDGYALTGTISGTQGASIITGTGTDFINELSPNDEVIYLINGDEVSVGVESVDSATQITISEEHDTNFSALTAVVEPEIAYRGKNRNWSIAGHELREFDATVVAVNQLNRIELSTVADLEEGDQLIFGAETAVVKRLNNNEVLLEANLQSSPAISSTVTQNPVTRVFVDGREYFITRDWTLSNTGEAKIIFNDLAEFNATKPRVLSGTFTFTNGSTTVSVTGADLKNDLRVRDWIRSDDILHTTWYEIMQVNEASVEIRASYGGTTSGSLGAERKNVEYFKDDSLCLVNCVGKEVSGVWTKTASDAVKDLLINDAGVTSLDSDSFDLSKDLAPFTLSLAVPNDALGSIPQIKKVVTQINESVFGSLINNSDWELAYNIFSPEKPNDTTEIKTDDIIGEPSISTKNKIIRKVTTKYRHRIDRFNGDNSSSVYEKTSDFVDRLVGTKNELEKDVYLFNTRDAETIGQRYSFYNSLSISLIKLKSKLNLSVKNVGDKLFLNLRRLYERFASPDSLLIGVITSISKDGKNTAISISDLGNIFTRSANITSSTADDFSDSDKSQRLFNGYVVDNDLEVPDTGSEVELGQNLIG